nr:endonuclease/exonuclease/phosphatase family protein [Pseudenhygromyxa sp. WMMC2535]
MRTALATRRSQRWEVPHPAELTARHGEAPAAQLCPKTLRVLVWNVFKGKRRSFGPRFGELARDRDLILAQELVFEDSTRALLDAYEGEWATATSFRYARRGGVGTGLGTAARASSLRVRALQTLGREPFTRTPKLALFTEYRLGPSPDKTLLVANVHAINFAGFENFRDQLRRIEAAVGEHRGPVLLAGDFNTWTTRRLRRLEELTRGLDLAPVEFADDRRTTPLDHAFVRELDVLDGRVHHGRASDHAALSFELGAEHLLGE